jgi:hypothetical protein
MGLLSVDAAAGSEPVRENNMATAIKIDVNFFIKHLP